MQYSNNTELELIISNGCPYAIACLAFLIARKLPFNINVINPDKPPQWFAQKSPLGKIPIALIDDKTVFESWVILEYIAETTSSTIHNSNPLTKAINRSWIAYASTILMLQMKVLSAKTEREYEDALQRFFNTIIKIEPHIKGTYFNGHEFCAIDAMYSPVFIRGAAIEVEYKVALLPKVKRLRDWGKSIQDHLQGKHPLIDDYGTMVTEYIRGLNSTISCV